MRDYDEQVKRLRNQAKLERYYNGSGEICDDAADAIEELLAENTELKAHLNLEKECYQKVSENYLSLLAKVPHWISVEDELPEEVPVDDERWSISVRPSADVNIYLPREGAIVTAFYSWADGTWITVNEDRIYSASEVLFWSKLPAPPKEDAR